LALRLEVAAPGLEVVEALLDRGYRGLARLEQLQHLLLRALEVRGDLRREQVLDAQLGELTEQVLALDVELEELGVRLREVGVELARALLLLPDRVGDRRQRLGAGHSGHLSPTP